MSNEQTIEEGLRQLREEVAKLNETLGKVIEHLARSAPLMVGPGRVTPGHQAPETAGYPAWFDLHPRYAPPSRERHRVVPMTSDPLDVSLAPPWRMT